MDTLFEINSSTSFEDLSKSRVCKICHQEKNVQDFEISSRSVRKVYRKSMCRPCNKNEREAEKSLKKIYGTTRPPGTPCDNCGKTTSRLSLDHCHDTGEFRGWLCQQCNNAIGMLGDDIEKLKQTVAYLERAQNGLHKTEPIMKLGFIDHG